MDKGKRVRNSMSTNSIEEITNNFEDISIDKTSVLFTAEDEIKKENIWSFTIINVISSTACLVSIFMIETINLSFVGHTNDSQVNLEAVGVGNILLNFTSLFLVFGALGGLDTVGSFCFGKKDFENLGIYGLMAKRSANYCFNMIPAIFFVFNFNLNVRYLQVMHDYFWVSVISVFIMVFHYLANMIMFGYYDSGYIMVAYITNVSTFIAFLFSTIYIIFFNKNQESLIFFHRNIFNVREFVFFLKLSFFSSLQHYGDFIGYEVVTFLGVYLPIKAENSASLVLLNYSVITAYLYSGSSYPLGQLVGYCLGKEDEDFYKFIIWTYTKLNLVVGVFLTCFSIFCSSQILYFYTYNHKIQELATPILYLYAIFSLVDNFNVMFQSILRGSGNQHIPSVWNIAMTIALTIPVSYILAFPLEMGVIGLWIGIFCFMTSMLIVSFFYTYTMDFKENCRKIHEQINGES